MARRSAIGTAVLALAIACAACTAGLRVLHGTGQPARTGIRGRCRSGRDHGRIVRLPGERPAGLPVRRSALRPGLSGPRPARSRLPGTGRAGPHDRPGPAGPRVHRVGPGVRQPRPGPRYRRRRRHRRGPGELDGGARHRHRPAGGGPGRQRHRGDRRRRRPATGCARFPISPGRHRARVRRAARVPRAPGLPAGPSAGLRAAVPGVRRPGRRRPADQAGAARRETSARRCSSPPIRPSGPGTWWTWPTTADLQPAENVVPVLRRATADRYGPGLLAALDAVSARCPRTPSRPWTPRSSWTAATRARWPALAAGPGAGAGRGRRERRPAATPASGGPSASAAPPARLRRCPAGSARAPRPGSRSRPSW